MKTAISVPDDVFRQVEAAANPLGVSRSEVVTRAVRRYLAAARDVEVKASYDAAFGEDSSGDVAELRRGAARNALLDVDWNGP